jgi:short-subunit dehydrogenase
MRGQERNIDMDNQDFLARYGPWALVTGATRGIGASFAHQLAVRGFNLVLVARQAQPLAVSAKALAQRHSIEVVTIDTDLAHPDFMDNILPAIASLKIGLLVSNAGVWAIGEFLEMEKLDLLNMLYVNCRAPLLLSHHIGKRMVQQGRGGIILLASTTANHGTPMLSHYAATKAYNLIFAEGLWGELMAKGVDVLALEPGATNTAGYREKSPKEGAGLFEVMEPDQVATEAIDALGKRISLPPGRINKLIVFLLGRILPRRRVILRIGDRMRELYSLD